MPITERGPDPTLRSAGQDPDDAARMARVLGGVVVAATAFGAVHGVAALLLADPAVGAFAALHLVVAGVAVVGRSLLLRGQVERSAFVMIPGILATAVAWLVLMPGLTEIAALAPILVVAYALPFATRRVLVRVVVTALGGGAILALTNRAATGLADLTTPEGHG